MLIKNLPTSNPPRFPSWIIALAFAALACTTLTRGPFIPQTPAAPFCILWISFGLPVVILNFATAYLRMIPPNPVVAKEGGIQTGLRGVVMSWWGGEKEIERG